MSVVSQYVPIKSMTQEYCQRIACHFLPACPEAHSPFDMAGYLTIIPRLDLSPQRTWTGRRGTNPHTLRYQEIDGPVWRIQIAVQRYRWVSEFMSLTQCHSETGSASLSQKMLFCLSAHSEPAVKKLAHGANVSLLFALRYAKGW